MKRTWWTPKELHNAARLLEAAASNLDTSFPHSNSDPNPVTVPAVKAMIDGAIACIAAAQPADK
jgi:hypothetical protein